MPLNYALYTELAVGASHPALADVVNRPLKSVLVASGLAIAVDPFPGFLPLSGGTRTITTLDMTGSLTMGGSSNITVNVSMFTVNGSNGNVNVAGVLTVGTFSPILINLAGGTATNPLIVTTTGAIKTSIRHDASNRLDISVSSAGAVTLTPVGASAAINLPGASFFSTVIILGTGLTSSADIGTAGAAVNRGAGAVSFGNVSQTTVGAAGGASALPATPTGYLRFFFGTTEFCFPYYARV